MTLVLLSAGPATATVRTYSVAPVPGSSGPLVFRLAHIAPGEVRAARLAGTDERRLSLRRIRRAVRRGILRVSRRRQSRARHSRLVLTLRPSPSRKPAPSSRPRPPAPAPPKTAPAAAPGPITPPAGRPETPLPPTSPPPADSRYVSPTGSDAASGSADAPWRTLGKALAAARPGDTIVLSPGAYGELGATTNVEVSGTAGAPITIMGQPGQARPTILGYTRVTGSHLRLAGLLFDGPTGPVLPKTAANPKGEEVEVSVMYGTDVEISGSEVRDNAWHAGIYVWDATNVRLVGNHIHDNGDRTRPDQANLDHGIYWCSGSGLVANNVVDHNLAYGVHLYPDTSDVTVTQNTIVHSGRGGVIVADRSAGNRILNNVVAYNGSYGIRGYELTGSGNVADHNLLWQTGAENFSGAGIALSSNVVSDPRFRSDDDLRPASSSPAIDAASTIATMPVDVLGIGRPRGAAPDLGAYEAG